MPIATCWVKSAINNLITQNVKPYLIGLATGLLRADPARSDLINQAFVAIRGGPFPFGLSVPTGLGKELLSFQSGGVVGLHMLLKQRAMTLPRLGDGACVAVA